MDTGGTFTDCIGTDPTGHVHRLKVLSNSVIRGKVVTQHGRTLQLDIQWPVSKDIFSGFVLRAVGSKQQFVIEQVDLATNCVILKKHLSQNVKGQFVEITSGEEVPVLAARLLTHTPLGQKFPLMDVRLGSTRGTNALLERKGAATAFLVTKGFKDLLLIGNQQRPDLFTINIKKPTPLYQQVFEVSERIAADGKVLVALNLQEARELATQLKRNKIKSVAIALLNAHRNSAHEVQLADVLRQAGVEFVSISHQLTSQIKLLSRAETAVANAYLDPIIKQYISGIQKGLSDAKLSMMTSSGSLVPAHRFFPKDSLLSGPAGGVVGAAGQAHRSGLNQILAFDMGGTSTDVSMYNGRYDYRFESKVGNSSILSPSLAIETIAAGGGSICDFDGHKLSVGPHSAGASPGPACYGSGGPLTITDVNLLLGRIDPGLFAIPINQKAAEKCLDQLLTRMWRITGKRHRSVEVLESFLQIANEKMAEAIRKISVSQGHDPRDFALLSFGGAGGQHACALASILGMRRIIVPYDAGLLSALGIGHAVVERFQEKLILKPWENFKSELQTVLDQLFEEATHQLTAEGFSANTVIRKSELIFLRFVGQDTSIEVDLAAGTSVLEMFKRQYRQRYGHWTDREVEVESVKVVAAIRSERDSRKSVRAKKYSPKTSRKVLMTVGGKLHGCSVYQWEDLKAGASIKGPSLVISKNSTTVIEPGWNWYLDEHTNGHLSRVKTGSKKVRYSKEAELELFTNRFTALAQEMGALLQRTSFSVNVKERLDFSCALLDARGNLVVNAPHIPVHLGSMGVCVREVMKHMAMKDGDVIITNHPAYGGSHLPDVTLIKPVFFKSKRVGFVANRAHHAEIGGVTPGSMPAHATKLDQEGVIISPTYLVKRGKVNWERVTGLLKGGRYPTRALDENLADLHAALASITLGESGLKELCQNHGAREISSQMQSLGSYAAAVMRSKISSLSFTNASATELLDDGTKLSIHVRKEKKRLVLDFTGSSRTHAGNLNATRAIVQSVVLYCLRLLIDQPLPMNEGLMEPVHVILPTGLLSPDFSQQPVPAVVGGNTEVSQRLTDTLLKAFGLAACSQGTMNNFLFGNEQFGYYETICGGTGAGEGFHGTDAVHQHMTNTRITDPEILELRYPVRLLRFEIRKQSGGGGKWRGGNGVIREIEALQKLDVSLLTQHRVVQPYGVKGGSPGKTGEQWIVRSGDTKKRLKGIDQVSLSPGDRLVIMTPGGGGWGK